MTNALVKTVKDKSIPVSIEYEKLEYKNGADNNIEWKYGLQRYVNRLPPGVFRKAITSIVYDKGKYNPEWSDKTKVKADLKINDEDQVKAMMMVLNNTTATELGMIEEVNQGVHAALVNLLGQSSKDVLMTDVWFRQNDDEEKDPQVTWECIMKSHITEREGESMFNMIELYTAQLITWTTMKQKDDELITDYIEREKNNRKSLEGFGLDVLEKLYGGDEQLLTIKWIQGLNSKRYATLIRDIANNIIEIPKTINEAAVLARNRKEVNSNKSDNDNKNFITTLMLDDRTESELSSLTMNHNEVLMTGNRRLIFGRPPLEKNEPYPSYSREVWKEASQDERDHVISHNRSIKKAAEVIQKQITKANDQKKKKKAKNGHNEKGNDNQDVEQKNVQLVTQIGSNEITSQLQDEYDLEYGYTFMVRSDVIDLSDEVTDVEKVDQDDNNQKEQYPTDEEVKKYIRLNDTKEEIMSLIAWNKELDEMEKKEQEELEEEYIFESTSESDEEKVIRTATVENVDDDNDDQCVSEKIEKIDTNEKIINDQEDKTFNKKTDVVKNKVVKRNKYKPKKKTDAGTVGEPCDYDSTIPIVEYDRLRVKPSKYVYGDLEGNIQSTGFGLICTNIIYAGQAIALFNGVVVDKEIVEEWSNDRTRFVIKLDSNTYLDCKKTALSHQCKASMSNTADKLYDCGNMRQLTSDDNNAAVRRHGKEGAMIYATKNIRRGTEILWDYGDEYWTYKNINVVLLSTLKTQDSCMVEKDNPFKSHYITLDNASGLHICKAEEYAKNIIHINKRSLSGIVETSDENHIYNRSCNMVDEQFGRCALAPKAISNILSQSLLVDKGFIITYVQQNDEYIIKHPMNENKFVFGRMVLNDNKTKSFYYVMDINTLKPPVKTECNTPHVMNVSSTIPTEVQNKAKYTKDQVKRADKAMQYLQCIAYPPIREAIDQIRFMANPTVTPTDLKIAYDIYGNNIAAYKGRSVKRQNVSINYKPIEESVIKTQKIEIDIMFIRKRIYVIAILDPLSYSFVLPVLDRKIESMVDSIDKIIIDAKKHGFDISYIHSDNEKAILSKRFQQRLAEEHIQSEVMAAGAHAPIVERRIRFIQDKVRTLLYSIPYTPFNILFDWMVMYANRLTNMHRATKSTSVLTPIEKYQGRTLDCARIIKVPFGSYVQTVVPNTDSSMAARTEAAIALMPRDNITGTWLVYKISTNKVVARDKMHLIPMPDKLISYINKMAIAEGNIPITEQDAPITKTENLQLEPTIPVDIAKRTVTFNDDIQQFGGDDTISVKETQPYISSRGAVTNVDDNNVDDKTLKYVDNSQINTDRITDFKRTKDRDCPVEMLECDEFPYSLKEMKEDMEYYAKNPMGSKKLEQEDVSDVLGAANIKNNTRRSERLEAARQRKKVADEIDYWDKYVTDNKTLMTQMIEDIQDGVNNQVLLTNMTFKQALNKHGKTGEDAIKKEILQFLDKEAFAKVDLKNETINKGEIIPSKLFLVEKFLQNKVFEKLKARLVARGDMQDKSIMNDNDTTAYTIEHSTVMMMLAIAGNQGREVGTADIGGAFLEASMPIDDKPVYVKIQPHLAKYILEVEPEYQSGVDKNGCLIVRLTKAMYGTIQAALLWFKHITEILINDLGFTQSELDPCLFFKFNKDGKQTTVCIHVDDLLMTSQVKGGVEAMIKELEKKFEKVTHEIGPELNYLGQHIKFNNDGSVDVTMDKMMEDIINDAIELELIDKHSNKRIKSPGSESLFNIDDELPLMNKEDSDTFHKMVARLLYLSKRVKPEMLLTISFLSTRVTKSTLEDMDKLKRVLEYLRNSQSDGMNGIKLKIGDKGMVVRAFIDAAYGVHEHSGKSQTGCTIKIGDASIFFHSSKQCIVVKSSTEAELVGMSDLANQVIHIQRILKELGYARNPAIIYQDNMSTITMIEKGKSTSMRTRHIDIRYFWLNEMIHNGEVNIQYLKTELMGPGNLLTKVLHGRQFNTERYDTTNWDSIKESVSQDPVAEQIRGVLNIGESN